MVGAGIQADPAQAVPIESALEVAEGDDEAGPRIWVRFAKLQLRVIIHRLEQLQRQIEIA